MDISEPSVSGPSNGLFPLSEVQDEQRLEALRSLGILDTPHEETFDDIVAVASAVCGAPISLVTLIDRDRQWFKASIGVGVREAPVDESMCAFTLNRSDIVVIPDLTLDPRGRDNPTVTGPDAYRFYAGAPLRTSDGHSLGTLCVVDTVPRPDGLTDSQMQVLRHLARQAVTQIEMRNLLEERNDLLGEVQIARTGAAAERARMASIIEHSSNFVALQLGADHAYEIVNSAYSTLVGGRDLIGRTFVDAMPDAIGQEFGSLLDEVYRTGRSQSREAVSWVLRRRPEAAPVEHFLDLYYHPVCEDGDVVGVLTIGHDVTERVKQVRRQEALVRLGERLRVHTAPSEIAQSAAEIVAEALEATRAGFGTVDAEAETVLMHPNWCAEGKMPVEGTFAFRDYGSFIDDLKAGDTVLIDDVETDPRTSNNVEALSGLGIRMLLNVPIIEKGHLALLAFVHFEHHRSLSNEDIVFIEQVADRTQAALARIEAEALQRALNDELAHRMKNALAMVQAIVSQTLRQSRTTQEASGTIMSRLAAMGRAQEILMRSSWEEADIRDVVEAATGPHNDGRQRISQSGPRCLLSSQEALGISLAIHELATNAAKYGALSNEAGCVEIAWDDEDGNFRFQWIENGGPPVCEPASRGFGSKLIEQVVASYFDGEATLEFAPDGVKFTLLGHRSLAANNR